MQTLQTVLPDAAKLGPRVATVPLRGMDPVAALSTQLGPGPFALVLLFVGAGADLPQLLNRASAFFGQSAVAGCTTAGELGENGYTDRSLVAVAFPAMGFAARTVLIDPIDAINTHNMIAQLQEIRQDLWRRAEEMPQELAVLLVDGMSGCEESLVASLTGGLGPVRIVGGSAGDWRVFRQTHVFCGERLRSRTAAVLCLLRSRMAMRTFSFNSARPSRTQMVVTRADPAKRAVLRINDEPAAREYARLLGCEVDELSPEMFATRPVMVRAGGRHFVRAIRGVGPDDALMFFGAVAEGMVLTLAEESDTVTHLDTALSGLAAQGTPRLVLGFDCIFRRMDAEVRQQTRAISDLLAQHRVVGFSTYGEQTGGMHLNQTLTGVAFYDPLQT